MAKPRSMIDNIPVWCAHDDIVSCVELKPNPRNPNTHPENQIKLLGKIIKEQGWRMPITVSNRSGLIVKGHGRLEAAFKAGISKAPVDLQDYESEADEHADMVADNRLAELAEMDSGKLSDLLNELKVLDIDMELTGFSDGELEKFMPEKEGLTDDDAVPDAPEDPVSKLGDLYILGEHRLLCGDATDTEHVSRLMGGQKAVLCHADPPYGMGKENDGIQNDNLYAEKLDAFQMAWWQAVRPCLTDNGSAYIWGNAEDLWRLWYCGGLKDSERLTFRNEIIWDKKHGQGIKSEQHRMFPTASERCLFFMLGEQGFNNNTDNYWDGFEPVRAYLDNERQKMSWNNKLIADWFGFHPRMADHWFSKSQWSFPQKEQYKRLQKEAKGKVFKREYDELKREFYATRAYFDNMHDNMTDIWSFQRVVGEERCGHATPKPVDMIVRAIKSSCPLGELVVEPFGGSGSTLIACQKTNRKCYMMEIDPHYIDVCIQRWENYTGQKAILESDTEAMDIQWQSRTRI